MTTPLREWIPADDPSRLSRLLSGSPLLARGEPVVCASDPLGLGAHRAGVVVDTERGATQGDHALPQRQAFRLPVSACVTRAAESADE
jgi:hypothetical protein